MMTPASASDGPQPPRRLPSDHPDRDRVRPGEPEVGGEHVEPPLVERLAECAGVRDHLAGVVAPEGEVLGEGDAEGRHRVKVVVAGHAGERPGPQAFLDVGVRRLGEQDAVLRARERLVGRGGEDLAPLVERVLELPAGDEAEDVGGIVPSTGPDLLEGRGGARRSASERGRARARTGRASAGPP